MISNFCLEVYQGSVQCDENISESTERRMNAIFFFNRKCLIFCLLLVLQTCSNNLNFNFIPCLQCNLWSRVRYVLFFLFLCNTCMDTLIKRNQMSEKTNKLIQIIQTMQRQKKITQGIEKMIISMFSIEK